MKRYTGTTFTRAVADCRMRVADFLRESTDMREAKIAEYVGHAAYSGYLKTKKRRKDEKKKVAYRFHGMRPSFGTVAKSVY